MDSLVPGVTVAWCTLRKPIDSSELGHATRLDLEVVGPERLKTMAAQLVVLDTALFSELEKVERLYRDLSAPVLLLVDADGAEEVLRWVRPSDMVCLRQTPSSLLVRLLVKLYRSRTSEVDALTGLSLRRQLLIRAEQVLEMASEAYPVSLLVANIDGFKSANDRHGHAVGDQVLRRVAAIISRCCRATELIVRSAGDEFAVLLVADAANATAQAEELRRLVEGESFPEEVEVTVSVGVATVEEPNEVDELLRQAHEALFAAKAGGRNRVESHREMERVAFERGEDLALTSFENLTRVVSDRIASTITRRGRQLFEQLKQQADVDALTQLFSRRYLDRRLEREFTASREDGLALTVAMIDLDHFGRINKRFGWPSGDRVLMDVAELIRSHVRATDWVGRYGGEELCLVMPRTVTAEAEQVLERVRKAVQVHPFLSTSGQPIALTVSAGAAELLPEDESLDGLMERVSTQLLEAKRSGRNRVRLASRAEAGEDDQSSSGETSI